MRNVEVLPRSRGPTSALPSGVWCLLRHEFRCGGRAYSEAAWNGDGRFVSGTPIGALGLEFPRRGKRKKALTDGLGIVPKSQKHFRQRVVSAFDLEETGKGDLRIRLCRKSGGLAHLLKHQIQRGP